MVVLDLDSINDYGIDGIEYLEYRALFFTSRENSLRKDPRSNTTGCASSKVFHLGQT